MHACRFTTQAAIRQAQTFFRVDRRKRAEAGKQLQEVGSEDDIIRMYGVLIALEKLSAQLQLFGTILVRDRWLQRSLHESGWQRRLRLFKFS